MAGWFPATRSSTGAGCEPRVSPSATGACGTAVGDEPDAGASRTSLIGRTSGRDATRPCREQRRVLTAGGDELVVRTELGEAAADHDTDAVGALRRRQPVGDHDHAAADHQLLERPLDEQLGTGIEARRRL